MWKFHIIRRPPLLMALISVTLHGMTSLKWSIALGIDLKFRVFKYHSIKFWSTPLTWLQQSVVYYSPLHMQQYIILEWNGNALHSSLWSWDSLTWHADQKIPFKKMRCFVKKTKLAARPSVWRTCALSLAEFVILTSWREEEEGRWTCGIRNFCNGCKGKRQLLILKDTNTLASLSHSLDAKPQCSTPKSWRSGKDKVE